MLITLPIKYHKNIVVVKLIYISLQNKLSRESLILVKNLKYLIANPLNVIRAGRALCEKYVRIKMLRHLI